MAEKGKDLYVGMSEIASARLFFLAREAEYFTYHGLMAAHREKYGIAASRRNIDNFLKLMISKGLVRQVMKTVYQNLTARGSNDNSSKTIPPSTE